MAQDRFADLRTELTERLRRFWRLDNGDSDNPYDEDPAPTTPTTPSTEGRLDRVRADQIPEELAREIVDNYDDDPEYIRNLDEDESDSLPILARVRPRGLFNDDWRARPTASRPWPVVLIHGTGSTKGDWQELGTELREDGWAVFAPDFGNRATVVIEESASQIGAYIDVVLQVTGAEQVILVGHSQGGVLARYWMRLLGGAEKVRHLVCLAVPNHGTTMGGIVSPVITTKLAENIMNSIVHAWFGPSGFQQITGHPIIEAINEGGDLEDGVSYTCIATRGDTVIQPPETCFLQGPEDEPERVRNLWVQDIEPRAVILHRDMPWDWRVRRMVRMALEDVVARNRV